MIRLGFLINPIAGMGGRVGLKGTDGVVNDAIELGAQPSSHLRAVEALKELKKLLDRTRPTPEIRWLTCSGTMGVGALDGAGFADAEVIYKSPGVTTQSDTTAAARRFLEDGVDIILFCGGDGTARDICDVVGQRVPMLGIPAGVKMYSGVFGVSPIKTAEILLGFVEGRLPLTRVDIIDLDEEKYRQGEWAVRLYHSAVTPYEPTYTQSAKMMIVTSTDSDVRAEIAGYILEEIESSPDALFLLGPGSTVQSIGEALGIDKTLLGVDAVVGRRLVGTDLDERRILELIDRYPRRRLVLSPIGAQGFVLGRGNLQLSPEVIRKFGRPDILVVATPAKLARTPLLRFDTGDVELDNELAGGGYFPVVIGYRLRRLVKVSV